VMIVREGITLGELAAVGAVVAAVCAVLIGPLLFRVRRHRSEIADLTERVKRSERVGELVCKSLTRGLIGIDNTLDWSSGILHRVLLGREEEVDATKVIEEMRTLRVAVERASSEVLLLAGTRTEQISALQQLTYRLGDHATVATLSEAASVDGFVVSSTALQAAHHELARRLSQG